MGFKTTKQDVDRSDFSKLMTQLDTRTFGYEMHQRLVEETQIIQGDKSQFDMDDINRVLANYPRFFSWVIVEAEIINEMYQNVEREYNEWYKEQYIRATENLPGKPTINVIEAKVVAMSQVDKAKLHRQLNSEGRTEDEIREILKYEGIDGRQRLVSEYQAKANMAKGMVKVWSNAIHSLQSLSKNIVAELELVKRQMGG